MIMRKIIFAMAAIIIAAFTSCSSSNESKEISPTSTEFTSGELAKLIEVVDEPCELSYVEKDGAIASQFIKLKVKLRLKKESPELKEVDAQDINFTKLLSIATINLVDENETNVQELNVKSEDVLKLKKLLQGKEGDEDVITFDGEFHNSDDAPTWFKETTAFTPYLTGDVIIGNGVLTSASSSFEIEGSHNLQGTVDKYPVTMHLDIDGSTVKGTYYYDRKGPNARLYLLGSNEDGILDLNETNADGTPTGHFKGEFSDGIFKGTFITNQGKKMPFLISENGASDIDFSSSDSELFDSDDFTMGEGDVSIDEFLDSYEKFWKKYMAFLQKVDKNNPAAMLEYGTLLGEYNEYISKFNQIKGNLSIEQINRMNKMNMEMAKAMEKMR